MELDYYLFINTIKRKDFAKLLGITGNYLSSLIHYRTVPSPQIALKIETLTSGQVKAWDLILKCLQETDKKNVENIKV